jgi:hypothetical protein
VGGVWRESGAGQAVLMCRSCLRSMETIQFVLPDPMLQGH